MSIFQFEWSRAPDEMTSDELRATVARLEIWMNDECVTTVSDKTNSTRRSIYVPLYPLAEWLAYSWWQFRQCGRDSDFAAELPRTRATSMRQAADGYIWPNLSFDREGSKIRAVWSADRTGEIRYESSGTSFIDESEFYEGIEVLIAAVVTRLDEADIRNTRLHEEWTALQALNPEEREFCDACGRLGLDPFSEGQDFAESIESIFESLDRPIFEEMIDAIDAPHLEAFPPWLSAAEGTATSAIDNVAAMERGVLTRLQDAIAEETARGFKWPYQLGYAQAKRVRSELELGPTVVLADTQMPVGVVQHPAPDEGLVGISVVSPERDRVAVTSAWRTREASRRFLAGRALWHVLNTNLAEQLLVTHSATNLQQTSRAFAAELLAPAAGIELLLRRTVGSFSVIADHYHVSDRLVGHQVDNQLGARRARSDS